GRTPSGCGRDPQGTFDVSRGVPVNPKLFQRFAARCTETLSFLYTQTAPGNPFVWDCATARLQEGFCTPFFAPCNGGAGRGDVPESVDGRTRAQLPATDGRLGKAERRGASRQANRMP